MANIGVPGTSGFVGEFLILAGIMKISSVATVLGATGMVLGGAYALWLFNRISYGNLRFNISIISVTWINESFVSSSL